MKKLLLLSFFFSGISFAVSAQTGAKVQQKSKLHLTLPADQGPSPELIAQKNAEVLKQEAAKNNQGILSPDRAAFLAEQKRKKEAAKSGQ